MSRSIRRLGARVAVSVASFAAFAAFAAFGAGPAAAASPAQSATADFMSGPFHVQFNAQRAAGAPATAATGSFIAHTALGTTNLLTLAGPVTCLDIRGNQMGLFYPVASSSPSLVGSVFRGVFIYVTVNATTGKPMAVNFLPTLSSTATSCAPLPGLAPITSGTVTLTS